MRPSPRGAVWGWPVGILGVFGAWSFYPTYNLGPVGDAGAITSDQSELLAAARKLRNYCQADCYHHLRLGANSLLDELQAALLLQRLPYFHAWTDRRRQIAARYWRELKIPALTLLDPPAEPDSHMHHLFVVRTHTRERHQQHLVAAGVPTLIHYPVTAHHQTAIGVHLLDPAGLPHTLSYGESCFSLPTHPDFSNAAIHHVIASCNALA